MKKAYRVRRRAEFQALYQQGRSYANRAAVLYVMPAAGEGRAVGFAAGKKLGKAVVRNRLKRLLREAVHRHWPRVVAGTRMLLIARAGARELSFVQLVERIGDLMEKAGVVVKAPPVSRGCL